MFVFAEFPFQFYSVSSLAFGFFLFHEWPGIELVSLNIQYIWNNSWNACANWTPRTILISAKHAIFNWNLSTWNPITEYFSYFHKFFNWMHHKTYERWSGAFNGSFLHINLDGLKSILGSSLSGRILLCIISKFHEIETCLHN